jgi:hypothetical protein
MLPTLLNSSGTHPNHFMRRPAGIEEIEPWIAKKGDQFSLLICHQHYPGAPYAIAPSWQQRKVIILRLSLQVDAKMYPMPFLGYDY